jgi:hypothetical protein
MNSRQKKPGLPLPTRGQAAKPIQKEKDLSSFVAKAPQVPTSASTSLKALTVTERLSNNPKATKLPGINQPLKALKPPHSQQKL